MHTLYLKHSNVFIRYRTSNLSMILSSFVPSKLKRREAARRLNFIVPESREGGWYNCGRTHPAYAIP